LFLDPEIQLRGKTDGPQGIGNGKLLDLAGDP
jgi:hypothetical protein